MAGGGAEVEGGGCDGVDGGGALGMDGGGEVVLEAGGDVGAGEPPGVDISRRAKLSPRNHNQCLKRKKSFN